MTLRNDDELLARLARLPKAVPDEAHRASVRARCHAALARKHRHAPAASAHDSPRWIPEVVAIGAVALAYLTVILQDAIRLLGAS